MKTAWLQGSFTVLPMYMGVIPVNEFEVVHHVGAPHVYGGDPKHVFSIGLIV